MKFKVIDKRTGLEADADTIVLVEDWAREVWYTNLEGFAVLEDGRLILMDDCGHSAYCPLNRFEVKPIKMDGVT